ncbi:MAG: LysR family transcriptional regulator [Alphaproteobacteria bacterium]|nr:LysR family transcriptional regulator [Alphaproteobacteria bacterium]MBU1559632.1 LysR family transcriptional regulator [Alphaproteobacteria bacterium]MBU2304369.1 LysR family transcriptional regulator [Alphaproteobacteria bacterium]MBU2367154.1 LysR family transcriptional regulator [Alphaproteobacteria bacterium]
MTVLDPDFLRSFLAIADTGSYGTAATRVHKTQSTVSAQMKRLEELLDVALFERVGRRNLLTPEGNRLLHYARSIVRLNDETFGAFRPKQSRETIKLGMSDDYAQAFLLPALARFSQRYPQVEVEVLTTDSRSLRQEDETGGFDAIVASCSSGLGELEVLRTDRLHWIGRVGTSLHAEETIPLALWADGCAWREVGLAALAGSERAYRVMHTTSNAPLLRAVVAEGMAVTVGPDWYLAPGLTVLAEMDRCCPLGEDSVGMRVLNPVISESLSIFLDYLRICFRSPGETLG